MLARIQRQAAREALRITQHAQKEMDDEEITLDEVLVAIASGRILEDYSEHKRGACSMAVPTPVVLYISSALQRNRC